MGNSTLKSGILASRASTMHLDYARKTWSRKERHQAGAALIAIHRRLLDEASEHTRNANGWAALNHGGMTRTFWVSKTCSCGLRKGEQVHSRAKMEWAAQRGCRFRTIRYPRKVYHKEALKEMAEVIRGFHHPSQFGFVPQRDCVESARRHVFARTVYLLDLENAFDQITQREVYEIFNRVFLVNDAEARMMASYCCHEGHLYQGNPLSPALFNIRALWLCERMERLAKANGGVFTAYADDLTYSSSQWSHISASFRKTVLRIIRECGFMVNPSKCKVRAVSARKIGHYDITGLAIDFDGETKVPYVRPLHRRRVLEKAQYLRYLETFGIKDTLELNKEGKPKELALVYTGLENWAKRKALPATLF